MHSTASLFDDASRAAVFRRVRIQADKARTPSKAAYLWALFEHYVAGLTDVPPAIPHAKWANNINEWFERVVRRETGVTINVGRVFDANHNRRRSAARPAGAAPRQRGGFAALFDEADRAAVSERVAAKADTMVNFAKLSHLWALYEHYVAGVASNPPVTPATEWANKLNAWFERAVAESTGITINVGRAFEADLRTLEPQA